MCLPWAHAHGYFLPPLARLRQSVIHISPRPLPWFRSPLVQITGLALAMTVLLPVAAIGAMDSHLLWFLAVYALPITLVLWIAADMKDHGRTPPFDMPFLLLLAFPISLFWYCISTRGWRGLALALGLLGLVYLPTMAVAVVSTAIFILAR